MLLLKDEYNVIHKFVLTDAHTHLKINELEGLVPSEFIRGYTKIVRDVAQDIKNNEKDYRYKFPWNIKDESDKYYDYCQKNIINVFHPGENLKDNLEHYIGFDFIITFSANLKSALPRDYRTANSKVREALIEKSPADNSPHNNFRFIGFGRLDPNHSDAKDAFDNIIQLGLRGLKLHPKEENFEIDDKKTQDILKRAAHYNIPVIFHTQEGMANRIEDVVDNTIEDILKEKNIEIIPRLKVILGHAPWQGVHNKELYRILSHPNIFGELSTLRPESYEEFFFNAKSKIKYENIFETNHIQDQDRGKIETMYYNLYGYNRFNYWSSKLMFGSDTPYPPSHSSAPLIRHLFSKKFSGGTSDIQNILGLSALRLIPPIAETNPKMGREKASTNPKYHPKKLNHLTKGAKALGMDPIIELFPRVRICAAVFSFSKDGGKESWLFKSLFDPTKPMNMVIPNPYDLSESTTSTQKMSITRRIEISLGKG